MEMCSCQREMAGVEEQLQQRNKEVSQLQAKLQEAERIIVSLWSCILGVSYIYKELY